MRYFLHEDDLAFGAEELFGVKLLDAHHEFAPVEFSQMFSQLFDSWDVDARFALLDFFSDRLKVQQREAGVRHDLIDAVFSAWWGERPCPPARARVKALQALCGDGMMARKPCLAALQACGEYIEGQSLPVSPVLDKATDAQHVWRVHRASNLLHIGEAGPFVDVDQGMRAAVAGNHGRTAGTVPLPRLPGRNWPSSPPLTLAEPQGRKGQPWMPNDFEGRDGGAGKFARTYRSLFRRRDGE